MSEAPLCRRVLPDGRILELWQMLYNVRITVTLPENDGICWEDGWCYKSYAAGVAAFNTWNGDGEPVGWNKHPDTGRWREDGTPESERSQRG